MGCPGAERPADWGCWHFSELAQGPRPGSGPAPFCGRREGPCREQFRGTALVFHGVFSGSVAGAQLEGGALGGAAVGDLALAAAHTDLVEGAMVLLFAVVSAAGHRAGDAGVGVLVFHGTRPPLFGTGLVCPASGNLFSRLLLLRAHHLRNEAPGKSSFAPGFDIKITNDGKDHRSDKVDEQIFHRVQNADVQVAAQTQGVLCAVGSDNNDIGDVPDDGGMVAPCRV